MKTFIEITIGIIILGILVTFLNPTHLLMPDTVNTMLILGLIVLFLAFVALVWNEKSTDERDSTHIQKSGRLSFFVGATVLVVGIIVQASMHQIDPWLVYTLLAMILAKLGFRIYQHIRS